MDNEPTIEEKTAAVQEAIQQQIESVRKIADDLDENEARVANAILTITATQQLGYIMAQLAQINKRLDALTQPPTLVSPDGKPIIQ